MQLLELCLFANCLLVGSLCKSVMKSVAHTELCTGQNHNPWLVFKPKASFIVLVVVKEEEYKNICLIFM